MLLFGSGSSVEGTTNEKKKISEKVKKTARFGSDQSNIKPNISLLVNDDTT